MPLLSSPRALHIASNHYLALALLLCYLRARFSATMDRALISVLLSSPESPIPQPWERCFDIRNGVLFYKNTLDDTILIDLRCQINLGGGLFHANNTWRELSGCTCCIRHRPSALQNQNAQPFLLHATCCGPMPVYLLMPELVNNCPFCGSFVCIVG
ncbi:hypothetical protein OIU76_019921 [Salix suchowensis]|uniref:Uncharacterized protein n=1 Tax=Salix suchowensis TaxID=1278906 RepID=A0ABQ8ZKQ8_9ROSI|nr:hypothetical protein OIU76_019921 [Salix suchowensis]KAJ6302304.1 hypothetical protein OIU77_016399 [Salix suchowensis]KAJ6314938.1 hypothetical protein OIU78_018427 [Salix suchowensis]